MALTYGAADGSERRNRGGVLKKKKSQRRGCHAMVARAEGEGSDAWVWVCKISKEDNANCGSIQYSESGGV